MLLLWIKQGQCHKGPTTTVSPMQQERDKRADNRRHNFIKQTLISSEPFNSNLSPVYWLEHTSQLLGLRAAKIFPRGAVTSGQVRKEQIQMTLQATNCSTIIRCRNETTLHAQCDYVKCINTASWKCKYYKQNTWNISVIFLSLFL
jgi:hypothetical protein